MRVLVHDYAGHPFQVQLSRALARRGHEVLHLHFSGFQTPKGPLAARTDDPPTFRVAALDIGEPFEKYRFLRRIWQERRYGRVLASEINRFRPDVVVSANAPLDVQAAAQRATMRIGGHFVFWMQDVYSIAIQRVLRRRLPIVGAVIAARFTRMERLLVRRSHGVVVITEDFLPALVKWGVAKNRITVVPNWAPTDDVRPLPKDNPWANEHGLARKRVALYSGTLGLKHNPALLLGLADALSDDEDARVVVISDGLGADWLRARIRGRTNLLIFPFQPFERLAEVIATGDVLLAILEPDAGVFSVPSKVLTYLAAGRPIVAAVPVENLAARTIRNACAGAVVDPADVPGFAAATRQFLTDPARCVATGDRARAYATATFDIERIASRFEEIFSVAITVAPPRPRMLIDDRLTDTTSGR
jgi:colanic acid biosynthesis glycosyl transferase WcaI